jgi:hypothetical protein
MFMLQAARSSRHYGDERPSPSQSLRRSKGPQIGTSAAKKIES